MSATITLKNNFVLEPNKAPGCLDQIESYSGSTIGAFRITQLIEKTLSVASETLSLAGRSGTTLARCAKVVKDVSPGFAIAETVRSTVDLPRTIKKTFEKPSYKSGLSLTKGAIDWICSFSFSALLFKEIFQNVSFLGAICKPLDFASNIIGLEQSRVEVIRLKSLKENLELKEEDKILADKQIGCHEKIQMWKVSKTIASIAGAILPMIAAVYGFGVPAISMMVVSLASTVFAVCAHFAEQNLEYKLKEMAISQN